jgi:hypothetical protein
MTRTSVRTLPSFLVIGAMRAGSTTLHDALSGHPEIFMSQPKELHFFVAERNWGRGVDWYTRQFAKGDGARARGEASATYSQYPQMAGVPGRAADVLPDARIVYLVRDPIARMRSQYEHDLRRMLAGDPVAGWTRIAQHGAAEQALLGQPKYLDASRYAMQVDQWLEHYSADDICVLPSEWMWSDPRSALRELFSFLGVDASWELQAPLAHLNAATRVRTARPSFGRSRLSRRLYKNLAQVVPTAAKRRVSRHVARQVSRDVSAPPDLDSLLTISVDVSAELRERLRDDVRRLRTHVRGPFDGWGIA